MEFIPANRDQFVSLTSPSKLKTAVKNFRDTGEIGEISMPLPERKKSIKKPVTQRPLIKKSKSKSSKGQEISIKRDKKPKPILLPVKNKLPEKAVEKVSTGIFRPRHAPALPLIIDDKKKESLIKKGGKPEKILDKIDKGSPSALKNRYTFGMLKPFKGVMKMALKKVGVSPSSDDIPIVTEQFYNNVVTKSTEGAEKGVAPNMFAGPSICMARTSPNHVDDAKDVMVRTVLDFINVSRMKKSAGEPLTDIEKIMADGADVVQTNLEKQAKNEAANKVGNMILFDRKTQVTVIVVVIVVIIIAVVLAKL